MLTCGRSWVANIVDIADVHAVVVKIVRSNIRWALVVKPAAFFKRIVALGKLALHLVGAGAKDVIEIAEPTLRRRGSHWSTCGRGRDRLRLVANIICRFLAFRHRTEPIVIHHAAVVKIVVTRVPVAVQLVLVVTDAVLEIKASFCTFRWTRRHWSTCGLSWKVRASHNMKYT